MVSKKRLNGELNGFRSPIIPRAPRSVRRRSPRRILDEDENLCAFELLAAVAGKLLEESEGSASCNVAEVSVQCKDGNEKEFRKDDKSLKSETVDRGSCAESAFVPEVSVQEHNLLSDFKGLLEAENDRLSAHLTYDSPKKLDFNINMGVCHQRSLKRKNISSDGEPSCVGECLSFKVEDGSEVQSEDEKNKIGDLSMANISTVKDPIGGHVNTNLLVNSESSVELPLYRNLIPGASLRKHWDGVKLGIRDDDENYFGCNRPNPKIRPFRPRPHTTQRRMRKMITSKYWKAVPKLKEWEHYNTSEGMKAFYRYRKSIYARERCQQAPIKKRKLSNRRVAVGYGWNTSSDSVSNMPEKADGASPKLRAHTKPKDHHLTVSIKSFKVPELYLEVPESATVGSLKRTVLEAVTTILGGGIRVGIVFQGKKVRDDNRTLQQAGIAQCSITDNLGFTLEPYSTHIPSPVTPRKLPVSSLSDADQNILTSLTTPVICDSVISNALVVPPLVKLDNVDNKDVVPSPNAKAPDNILIDEAGPESMALVPVSPIKVEALAAVPVNQKPKRPELSQRRTRRPFSVSEVESLVEAVEKLGTGRWRDVKMRAFEDADHRTYVDLKDKWKTLVHTASISPQQRRGEPVPHELLNRVLSAHSYWSQHQSKQLGKPQSVEPPLFADLGQEVVGA